MKTKISEKKIIFPQLDNTFRKLQSEGRAKLDYKLSLPVRGKQVELPYAYMNGKLNLIEPQRFDHGEASTLDTAHKFAVQGDLFNRHETPEGVKTRYTVITSFSEENCVLKDKVDGVFKEYNVETLLQKSIEKLINN